MVWVLGITVNMQVLLPVGIVSNFVLRREVAQKLQPFIRLLVCTFGSTYHPFYMEPIGSVVSFRLGRALGNLNKYHRPQRHPP